MGQEPRAEEFHHRDNGNGTVDSICLICFRTVGQAESELRLSEFESRHVCEDSVQQSSVFDMA